MNIKNSIIYKIFVNNMKTISIIIIYIIGSFIYYSHLYSIDAIELFTTNNTGLFISLFFIAALMILFLSFLFAMPYLSDKFIDIDKNKISNSNFRIVHHKVSSINIMLFPIIIAGILFIASFYSLNNELKNSYDYLSMESMSVNIIIIIVPLLIFSIYINRWYYKFILEISKENNNKTDILFTYIFHIVAIPNTFLIIWFMFSTFFGFDSPRENYDIIIFAICFLVISTIYFIPMEEVEFSIKKKTYKVIVMSVLCMVIMIACSFFSKTLFTDNIMKLIGKSDKKDYPYIIHNRYRYRYGLPNMSNNIYCGRALWRDENVIVFLPIGEDDKKKKRLIIDKKYIYPLQGEKRLTYCNK